VDDYCKTNVDGVFLGDNSKVGLHTYNDFQIVEDYIMGNKKKN
jgi:hypothetical protein